LKKGEEKPAQKPTLLYLIRHGETLSNIAQIYQGQGDGELSEVGKKEAENLAEGLKDVPFTAAYSSDLKRSHDTAKFIAKPHRLEVQKVPELKERFYGKWEGMSFSEIKEACPELYDLWMNHPDKAIIPAAETLEELQRRGVDAIKKIVKRHPGETILVVGHGALNRGILFYYMHMDLDNFWSIRQANLGVNIIEFNRFPTVSLLNCTHFKGGTPGESQGYY
jgi:broad specificity phosphatase PhoE